MERRPAGRTFRFKGDWRALSGLLGGVRALMLYGLVVAFAVLVFVLDRTGAVSALVRSWGPGGVLLAVLLMLLVCLTPVPSEGLLLVYLKVYGVWWGVFFGWLGAIGSAAVIFPLARRYGQVALRRFASAETFQEIDEWVRRRGQVGLLLARLMPLPQFAVGYVAGTLPSVGLWAYLWTAGVSLIPYYAGVALVFLGVTSRFTVSVVLGIVAMMAVSAFGIWIHRRSQAEKAVIIRGDERDQCR